MTVFGDNDTKTSNYIQDARAHGIKVLPPDINRSVHQYTITENNDILYGFDSIKGISQNGIDEIIEHRPFNHIAQIIERCQKRNLNKKNIKVLALSGALDSIASNIGNRMQILELLYKLRGDAEDLSESLEKFNKRKMLELEKEYLGVYVSGHPLEGISRPVDWDEAIDNRETVTAHCMLHDIRRITTKKGDPMAFLTLQFLEKDLPDIPLFPNLYQNMVAFRKGDKEVPLGDLMKENMILKVVGRFEEDNRNELKFMLKQVTVPVKVNIDKSEEIKALQDEIGVEAEVPEEIHAPVFEFDNMF